METRLVQRIARTGHRPLLIGVTTLYRPPTMVWRRHPAEREFIAALATIDLPKSYDAQVAWDSDDGDPWEGSRDQIDGVLAGVEPSPRYHSKERFFRITYLEPKSYLHLSWSAERLEIGLYVFLEAGDLGGPLHGLADKARRQQKLPALRGAGRYPRIPIATTTDARRATDYALAVFERVRQLAIECDIASRDG